MSDCKRKLVFADTDRYGRIAMLYGGEVERVTKSRFLEFLEEVRPSAIVADKPLNPSYPQIVLRRPQLISQVRRTLGLEKSEENDVKALKYIYETRPDAFKRCTATERLIGKYMAVVKVMERVKESGVKRWREVKKILFSEIEEELAAVLDHEIYRHAREKARKKFGLNLNSLPLKLLVQYTVEMLRESPTMSLSKYLRKLGLKGGKIHRLLSIAAHPIRVHKREKRYGRICRYLAYVIYHGVKESLGGGVKPDAQESAHATSLPDRQ